MTFPQYAVSKWIGHSITVSGRHYANDVPDELFAKAADIGAEAAAGSAQRNAQQKMHDEGRNDQKRKRTAEQAGSPTSSHAKDFQAISTSPCQRKKWSRGESNPRPVTVGLPPLPA